MILIFSVCAYIYVSFSRTGVCLWSCNPHFRWKYSSNAVSVQMCEQRNIAIAVHLHLHFHSVRNLSVYTVCNSSACWCAGKIKLLNWSERKVTDHIRRHFSEGSEISGLYTTKITISCKQSCNKLWRSYFGCVIKSIETIIGLYRAES